MADIVPTGDRREMKHRSRSSVHRRRALAGVVVAITAAIVITLVWPSAAQHTNAGGAITSTTTAPPARTVAPTIPPIRLPARYHEAPLLTLDHAVADPAAGFVGNQVLFAAGLDATGTSTARVGSIRNSSVQTMPALPKAFHDAAGAALGHALYLFGGGDGVRQLDSIFRVDSDGTITSGGTIPAPSSDSIAATIGNTAYIVGGYTGTNWLDTIVAFTPNGGPRIVAHLPVGVRYAAVGAADGRLVIVGGTTTTADATTAIYRFDPATAAVTKIGDLAQPISHAAAVGVGREVIVAGGQNNAYEPQAAIVAINPITRRVRDAGSLTTARSDAALVKTNRHLIMIGGKTATTTVNTVTELVPASPTPAAATTNVYAHDRANALSPEAAPRPTTRVRPEQPVEHRQRDRPGHLQGDRPVPGRRAATTRHPVVGREDALRRQRPREQPHPDRSAYRKAPRSRHPGHRSLQPLLHTQRSLRDRCRRSAATARFPQCADDAARHERRYPCRGADHMDYTADGKLALVSCEFSGQMLVVDLPTSRCGR